MTLSISSFLDFLPVLSCSSASSRRLSLASIADFCCSNPALTSCESVSATSSYLAVRVYIVLVQDEELEVAWRVSEPAPGGDVGVEQRGVAASPRSRMAPPAQRNPCRLY